MWLIVFLASTASAATDCEALKYDTICAIDFVSTIAILPAINTEVTCQAECANLHDCSHFTFFTSSTQPATTSCALLRSCPANTTTTCSSVSWCSMAVTGPQTPAIVDSCCTGLANKACKGELLAQHFQDGGPGQCQDFCRRQSGCRFYSQYSDTTCFLYATCPTTQPCSVCTSGSISPDWDQCTEEGQETLLMGGWTNTENSHATSIELVTDTVSCTADMPELPIGSHGAAATVLGETILHCGGHVANAPNYRAD